MQTIKGVEYAFFDAAAGSYTATYGSGIEVAIDSLSKSLLGAGDSAELKWHGSENGAFALRVGGADCATGTVIDSGTYAGAPAPHTSNLSAASLAEGQNTLRLCLTDAAQNAAAVDDHRRQGHDRPPDPDRHPPRRPDQPDRRLLCLLWHRPLGLGPGRL